MEMILQYYLKYDIIELQDKLRHNILRINIERRLSMNIAINEINQRLSADTDSFIRQTNESYMSRLTEIAEEIAANRDKRPIILVCGPSGSGKTTTALMLEKLLDGKGFETHTLSLDNYFSPLTDEEKERLATGEIDLESPLRVDSAFLTEQLNAIDACEPVELPIYDFKESTRISSGNILQRKPGELVILEGIHSLNPEVIGIPDEKTAKIYVSVRTRITNGEAVLHPSKIRLMRRFMRDRLFRKRSLSDTLAMFASVEAGENKYIMPYKYRSDYDVDTFMSYEICAYRDCLFDDISAMKENPVIGEIYGFLSETSPLSRERIPSDSLICEFIGGEDK